MNADSYFEIGSSHMVCQDYALSGNYKDMWYGIVSDGCSSAEYSEIGAQVLCHTTKNILMVYYDLFFNESVTPGFIAQFLTSSLRIKADEVRKIYPISRDALQATLLISLVVKRKNRDWAFVFAWGDGVIIRSVVNGAVSIEEWDFPNTNAPVYLTTNLEAYTNKFAIEDCIKRSRMITIEKDSLRNLDRATTLANHVEENKHTIFYDPIIMSYPVGPGDFIALATDGLTQYQDQNKKPIETIKMVPLILDYPNYNGQFVKRTMNFLKRDLARKNWSHADDVGIATLVNV